MDEYHNELFVDLRELFEDYKNGYSAFGNPDRAYYINSWRGIESLQTYSTSEAVREWSSMPHSFLDDIEVIESKAKEENKNDYYTRKMTKNDIIQMMENSLGKIDPSLRTGRGYWDSHEGNTHEALIKNIFGGQMDRKAAINAILNEECGLYTKVLWAMQYNILRAIDGKLDLESKAAASAYSVLSNNSNKFKIEAEHYYKSGPFYSQVPKEFGESEWWKKGCREYIDFLLDSSPNSERDIVDIDEIKKLVERLVIVPYGILLSDEYGSKKWDEVEEHLKAGVPSFFSFKTNVRSEIKDLIKKEEEFELDWEDDYLK